MPVVKNVKKVSDAIAKVDGIIATLNNYPTLEEAVLDYGQQKLNQFIGNYFPTKLDFITTLLKHITGKNVMIEMLADFLYFVLPEVEIALKAALLANMQNLGTSCEIDPIIWEKAIKDGIIFDLKQIDLYDKLTISPLDEKLGKHYYFGIDGCESAHDVLMSAIDPSNQTDYQQIKNGGTKTETSYLNRFWTDSMFGHYFNNRKRDFDCLLWYMKNKATNREVWGKRTAASEDIFLVNNSDAEDWMTKMKNWYETGFMRRQGCHYYRIDEDKETSAPIGKYIVYVYDWDKTNHKANANYGDLIEMKTNITYCYLDGQSWYAYEYGFPLIKKVDRKKEYFYKSEDGRYSSAYFIDNVGKWDIDVRKATAYNTMADAAKVSRQEIDNSYIVVNNILYYVDYIVKYNEKGTITETKFNTEECINITTDIDKDLAFYVDYDLTVDVSGQTYTYGQLIKNKDFKSIPHTFSFGEKVNKGTASYTWKKNKMKEGPEKSTDTLVKIDSTSYDIYFFNKNNNYYKIGETSYPQYDENVDEIVITPLWLWQSDDKKKWRVNKCLSISDKVNKYTSDFGVLTLEFTPHAGNVLQSDGNPMYQQTPYDNVLHVFFGNVKEIESDEVQTQKRYLNEVYDLNKEATRVLRVANGVVKKIDKTLKRATKKWKKDGTNGNNTVSFPVSWQKERLTLTEKSQYIYNEHYWSALVSSSAWTRKENWGVDLIMKNVIDTDWAYPYNGGVCHYGDENELQVLESIIRKINDTIFPEEEDKRLFDKMKENSKDSYYNNGKDDIFFKSWDPIIWELAMKKNEETEADESILRGYSILAYVNRIGELLANSEKVTYSMVKDCEYPSPKQNFYYKKTLFEFNYDYINSLQLFDTKVMAAQIIGTLFQDVTFSLGIGMTASWKMEYIHQVVKNMVIKMMTLDGSYMEVSDCFFTFSPDAYSEALRAAELKQAGLYTRNGESNGIKEADVVKILESLNDLDETAEPSEQKTIIQNGFLTAASAIGNVYNESGKLSMGIDVTASTNILEALVTNTCTQLVMTMLSPKVYLLILINLEMFGMTTNFTLEAFIERFKNLIFAIVKAATNLVTSWLLSKITDLLNKISLNYAFNLNMEQAMMYTRLIKQVLQHLKEFLGKFQGQTYGWVQDYVQYADTTEGAAVIDDCITK